MHELSTLMGSHGVDGRSRWWLRGVGSSEMPLRSGLCQEQGNLIRIQFRCQPPNSHLSYPNDKPHHLDPLSVLWRLP